MRHGDRVGSRGSVLAAALLVLGVACAGAAPGAGPLAGDPAAELDSALDRIEARDLAGAEAIVRSVLSRHPELAAAHNHLGGLLVLSGKPGEAEAAYREAIRLAPGNASARYNLGLLLQGRGRLEEALAAIEEAARLGPGDVVARRQAATLAIQLEQWARAREHERAVLQLEPKAADVLLALVESELRLEDFPAAREAAQRLVEAVPGSGEAWYRLGIAQHELRQFMEATASYRRAKELGRAAPDLALNLASTLLKTNHIEESVAELQQAVAAWPQSLGLRTLLAECLNKGMRFEEAAKVLEGGPEAEIARSAEWAFQRGVALAETDRPEEAEAQLRHALEVDPAHAGAHYRLGRLLLNQGRSEEGRKLMEAYQRLYRQKAEREEQAALIGGALRTGEENLRQGDLQAAAAAFEKCLELDPKQVRALAGLARVRVALGQRDAALQAVERAVLLAGDQPALLESLAQLLEEFGETDRAVILRARAREPRRPGAATVKETP